MQLTTGSKVSTFWIFFWLLTHLSMQRYIAKFRYQSTDINTIRYRLSSRHIDTSDMSQVATRLNCLYLGYYMCKYELLYIMASAIAVLRVQLRFVDCFNKRKKKKNWSSDGVGTAQQNTLWHSIAPMRCLRMRCSGSCRWRVLSVNEIYWNGEFFSVYLLYF